MATWVNIMDIIYPVGSVYLNKSSTSPASTIGGTWTQIKGATLAATGANGFAGGVSYGGSLKISVNQIPSHIHPIAVHMSGDNADFESGLSYTSGGTNNTAFIQETGGKTICLTTGVATSGIALHNFFLAEGGAE